MSIKANIFDFDGVIHDTFHFHWNKVKEFSGADISEEEFRDIHNGNFFENKHDLLSKVNWAGYRDHIYEDQVLLKMDEDTKQTLLELSKNYELFVVSSGGTKNISDYLKNNEVYGLFQEIMGLEGHMSKEEKFKHVLNKYSLFPADCVFITDTLGDILEANKIDIKTIAVDFGYHDKENLLKGNPFKVISDIRELPGVIGNM